ncbi:MAG: carboxypeptidase regulatory-like domain-containing protein [Elusimicrobia bacterium]|nr:carboxypeptidase regulatory-like domain-containing protein [Elusimicrobiota bacterium]
MSLQFRAVALTTTTLRVIPEPPLQVEQPVTLEATVRSLRADLGGPVGRVVFLNSQGLPEADRPVDAQGVARYPRSFSQPGDQVYIASFTAPGGRYAGSVSASTPFTVGQPTRPGLRGRVLRVDLTPARGEAGVTITVTRQGETGPRTVPTDAEGRYQLRDLLVGTYGVTATKERFTITPASRTVILQEQDVEANFEARARQPAIPPEVLELLIPGRARGQRVLGVSPRAQFRVRFSKPMDLDSLRNGGLEVRGLFDHLQSSQTQVFRGQVRFEDASQQTALVTFTPALGVSAQEAAPNLPRGWGLALHVTPLATDVEGRPLAQPRERRFHTVVDRQRPYVLVAEDQRTRIRLEANALSTDGFLDIEERPLNQPLLVNPAALQEALETLRHNFGPQVEALAFGEVLAFDEQGAVQPTALQAPAMVSLPLPQVQGLSQSPLDLAGLDQVALFRFDPDHRTFVRLPTSQVDLRTQSVRATVTTLGTFALIRGVGSGLDLAHAFPVPFKPAVGHTRIFFTNLPVQATIRIYTVSGDLVRELTTSDGSGQLAWDVTNAEGEPLGSDVFYYVLDDGRDKKQGKLMVIR